MNRQSERRKLVEMAFGQMPLHETWTTEDGKPSATYEMVDGHLKLVEFGAKRNHVRTIPRRVRRSMARDLAKRRWKIR